MRSPVNEIDISDYADNEVAEERRQQVEALLTRSPEAAARLAAYVRQNDQLRAIFQASTTAAPGVALRQVLQPASYEEPIRQSPRLEQVREARRLRLSLVTATSFLAGAAVALTAAAVLGMMPMFLEGARTLAMRPPEALFVVDPFQSFLSQALSMHRTFALDTNRPVEYPASEPNLASMLSKRVGFVVPIPDLSSAGFHLLGARLLPGEAGASAFLVYETSQRERLGLLTSDANGLAFGTTRYIESVISLAAWTQDAKIFALSGSLTREVLSRLVAAARMGASPAATAGSNALDQ